VAPGFKDHFSTQAACYAQSRPSYPPVLFDWLKSRCLRHDVAWDCGAGNGQASRELGRHFRQVVATDASHAQIAQAVRSPGIDFVVALAEQSCLDERCIDLVTIAQALHWFDLERFYAEAARVLRPGGLVAAWSYGMLEVEDAEIDTLVQRFYHVDVGAYWPAERRHVESGYRDIHFPFNRMETPLFTMEVSWNLQQLLGYLRSWSATARFVALQGFDPVIELEASLREHWGDDGQERSLRWPLALLVGQVDGG
jgi:SAM-dependent methyltransferase